MKNSRYLCLFLHFKSHISLCLFSQKITVVLSYSSSVCFQAFSTACQYTNLVLEQLSMAKAAIFFCSCSCPSLQKTWCVAKPSSDQATLLANLNYACSHVDCQILRKGCPCSSPDNLMNHASIAMNQYCRAKGNNQWNCDFRGSALIVMTDPSYGDCIYA